MDASGAGAVGSLGVVAGFTGSYLASRTGLDQVRVIALAAIALAAIIGIVIIALAS